MEISVAQMILAAAVAAAASSTATVLMLKVDVRWIKRALGKLETRVTRIENEVFQAKRS